MPLIYFVLHFKRCFHIHNFAYLVSWVEFFICRVAFIIRCKCTIRGAFSFSFILFLLSSFVLLYLLPNIDISTFLFLYCQHDFQINQYQYSSSAYIAIGKGWLDFSREIDTQIFGKVSKIRILWNHLEMS